MKAGSFSDGVLKHAATVVMTSKPPEQVAEHAEPPVNEVGTFHPGSTVAKFVEELQQNSDFTGVQKLVDKTLLDNWDDCGGTLDRLVQTKASPSWGDCLEVYEQSEKRIGFCPAQYL